MRTTNGFSPEMLNLTQAILLPHRYTYLQDLKYFPVMIFGPSRAWIERW